MKLWNKVSLLLVVMIVAMLAFPMPVHAQGPDGNGDQVIFGGTFHLDKDQSIDGDLLILGGVATLDDGSTVKGDITVMGGVLSLSGQVNGSIQGIGGTITLNDSAVINGSINTVGVSLQRSDKAQVKGSVTSAKPGEVRVPNALAPEKLNTMQKLLTPVRDFLWAVLRTLVIAALALLVGLFLPVPLDRVSRTVMSQPLPSAGLGLLTLLVAPILLVLLALTIILSPISLVGILVLVVTLMFGWIALGYETGVRIAAMFKAVWAVPVSAAVGTLVISLLGSIFLAIPCVGWVIPATVSLFGVGAVILTMFGSREPQNTIYPPRQVAAAPVPVAAAVSPQADVAVEPAVTPAAVEPQGPFTPVEPPTAEPPSEPPVIPPAE